MSYILSQTGIGPSIVVSSLSILLVSESKEKCIKLNYNILFFPWITGIPLIKLWTIEWVWPETTPSIKSGLIEFKNLTNSSFSLHLS